MLDADVDCDVTVPASEMLGRGGAGCAAGVGALRRSKTLASSSSERDERGAPGVDEVGSGDGAEVGVTAGP